MTKVITGTFVVMALLAHAAAPGRHLSGDYVMTVDGKDVDVISVPTPEKHIWNKLERQPYSYAPFVASKEVEVCVKSGFLDLSKTVILPQSKGVAAVSQSVDTVVFRMKPPMTLVLEPKGRHRALVVSANLPEAGAFHGNAPTSCCASCGCSSANCTTSCASRGCSSANCTTSCASRGCSSANCTMKGRSKVKSFGPGFHRAGKIALGDGETLYLVAIWSDPMEGMLLISHDG